jgi:flagellar basal-body rod protein FlgF
MLRGYYAAAAGMLANQRRQELLTNNLSNANTPGYKADESSMRAFPEMLLTRLDSTSYPNNRKFGTSHAIGHLNTGVYMQEAALSFLQGPLQETGHQTDLALFATNVPNGGALFFEVQGEGGDPMYTRNGSFAIDQDGFLTTGAGHYLLDENGEQIQILGNEFKVEKDGTVVEDGAVIARLNIAHAEDPNVLTKQGNGLFAVDGGGGLPSAIGNGDVAFRIEQGFLERSNVDPQRTMSEMLMAYRSFEANQKVLRTYDESMDKAVNEIGRIG